jgi:hypothetical protein
VVLLPELDRRGIGDRERVRQDIGAVGELRGDFRVALEVQATIVPHPVAVTAILAEPDTQEDVVCVVVVRAEKVRVVRRDDRQVEILRQAEDLRMIVACTSR